MRSHAVTHRRHALRACPEIQHIAVPTREGSFRLHRIADHPAGGQRHPHDKRSASEGGVGRSHRRSRNRSRDCQALTQWITGIPRRKPLPWHPPLPAASRARPQTVRRHPGPGAPSSLPPVPPVRRRSGHDRWPAPGVAARVALRLGLSRTSWTPQSEPGNAASAPVSTAITPGAARAGPVSDPTGRRHGPDLAARRKRAQRHGRFPSAV